MASWTSLRRLGLRLAPCRHAMRGSLPRLPPPTVLWPPPPAARWVHEHAGDTPPDLPVPLRGGGAAGGDGRESPLSPPSPTTPPPEQGNLPVPGANRPRPPAFVAVTDIEETDDTPEDLKLPVPGDPVKRAAAGLLDAALAAAVGGVASAVAYYSTGVVDAAETVGIMVGTLAWVARDAVWDDGNRSLGKKANGLEITYWDGTLAPRSECLKRNTYWLVVPFVNFHPLTNQLSHVFVVFDIASVLVTDDVRKVGDYLAGTRVVNERPNRQVRLEDMQELEELKMLERRLSHLEHEA